RFSRDWSSDVCSSDLIVFVHLRRRHRGGGGHGVFSGLSVPHLGLSAALVLRHPHPLSVERFAGAVPVLHAAQSPGEPAAPFSARSEERRGGTEGQTER